ncbi:MAG: cation transporter [Calothrix sp. MO_167.B42]|nr:cation transporter [Calothrix sp. MO_167.B42]
MNTQRLEKFAINLSIFGSLSMAILGISYGLYIESAAVMLDGFFNIISFSMALATRWISLLLKRPEGNNFQFGFKGTVPLINLCKGLLVAGLSVFAFISAVGALLRGGRELNAGSAVIYAAIAASVGLTISITQTTIAKKTGSPIVRVDAQNWMINGFISLCVGIAFGIVTAIQNTPFSWFVPYADPALVTILVILSCPMPAKVITESIKQLLLGAPEANMQKRIHQVIGDATTKFPCARHCLRMTQAGQDIYLHLHWLFPQDEKLTTIEKVDIIRDKITNFVTQEIPNSTLDIIFTQDEEWFGIINPQ